MLSSNSGPRLNLIEVRKKGKDTVRPYFSRGVILKLESVVPVMVGCTTFITYLH